MNKILELLLRSFLAFLYILGLSFVIPVLLSAQLPGEIVEQYNSAPFLVISVVLVITSIAGTVYISKDMGHMFRNLGFYSLIPGALALVTTVFGKDFLVNLFSIYSEALEPLIRTYLDARVPKLWFLTVAYLMLGIVLYFVGRKLK